MTAERTRYHVIDGGRLRLSSGTTADGLYAALHKMLAEVDADAAASLALSITIAPEYAALFERAWALVDNMRPIGVKVAGS